jgi:hypothetical protein
VSVDEIQKLTGARLAVQGELTIMQ